MVSFILSCFLALHVFWIYPAAAIATEHITTTATITKTVALDSSTSIVLASSRPTTSTTPEAPYSASDVKAAVLNSTNFFRTRFLAEPVTWDATLAAFAQQHAEACVFEHSGGPYGENLAEGFATPTLGVDAWAAEEKHYQYPNGGFSERTGHFTQLVWQGTTRVGCAAVNCGTSGATHSAFGWYLVCEYSPPGNVIGDFEDNVRKPGESADGKLGFGTTSGAPAQRRRSSLALRVALVTMSSLAVSCL